MSVAFIGLGAMGGPMAANLAAAGPTLVHNRTSSVAEEHASAHGSRAVPLAEVVAAEVIITCLPTTREVAEVADALAGTLRAGTIWVDATSGDPAPSRRLAQDLADAGVDYLDAPVSGGTGGAAAGTLTVMVGGDAAVLERARPWIEPFAGRIVHVGPVGAGHAVKAVNNTLMAVNLWAAGEGLAALAAAGVQATDALEVINHSSGASFASQHPIPERVVTREWPVTFALGLLAKDIGIAQHVIDDSGMPAPLLRLVRELFEIARRELGNDADHAEAVKIIEAWSGHEIR